MNNDRTIAIINAFSKIFGKIISRRLVTFLTQNIFFVQEQFGFLQARSIQTMQILNIITSALNEGEYSILVLLDVQKAFRDRPAMLGS